MDILTALQQLGLPGWFLIAASTIVILHYTGALTWLGSFLLDKQEHAQEIELRHRTYEDLQSSWREDRIATLLEENESFVREQVWNKLKDIETTLKKLEMTISQTRDTLSSVYREIYRKSKHDDI